MSGLWVRNVNHYTNQARWNKQIFFKFSFMWLKIEITLWTVRNSTKILGGGIEHWVPHSDMGCMWLQAPIQTHMATTTSWAFHHDWMMAWPFSGWGSGLGCRPSGPSKYYIWQCTSYMTSNGIHIIYQCKRISYVTLLPFQCLKFVANNFCNNVGTWRSTLFLPFDVQWKIW
jgi:hypothetical protein